ncbi:low molecular weight protein tyrosine phosphatase family protein [Calothrix sp. UHCC 0171]|uniref:low molecular weight protein tyrosine phosphatase family protein n=1 Tax=Calothrix sp. UHCC 0171 TaxID=3110245 RepID=UPI002B1F08B3|nr:low molecular weight protein tyrosine phosphatase family protein [Calothrix sp. UHCC 0171]MEA5574339.1 low molecular weight protein tyrosine phosphatase family protein [Calothrix sp. UHCC 0171]
MKKLLFICSQNKLRSPTAEAIFSEYPNLEAESAGLNHDAEVPVSPEAIEWADMIFVMEKVHRQKLSQKFQPFLKGKRIICLDIPDEYDYMNADLIKILKSKVLAILGTY